MKQQIEVTAYSLQIFFNYWNSFIGSDVGDIVSRALELQEFVEFYDEDTAEAIASVIPTPLMMAATIDDNPVRYAELADKLGQFPYFYRYTFDLELLPNQLPGGPRVKRVQLGRYISYDEFEGDGDTLKDLGAHIPGAGGVGVYCVTDPDEFWLIGKLKKDHIRVFFSHMRYPHFKEWEAIVVSQYPYILQDAAEASLEWDDLIGDDAMMLVLEMIQNHQNDPDEVLDSLLGTMMASDVIQDAYRDFQSNPWSALDAHVYRQIYARPDVVDAVVETLVDFYTRDEEHPDHEKEAEASVEYMARVNTLLQAADKVVRYLIDAFAPLIGEWRLAAFASEMCARRGITIPVKEYSSLGEGLQTLAANPERSLMSLDLGQYEKFHLFLRPEESIPRMTLIRSQRLG